MYNKLFTKILDSSIWLESAHVRIVWVTFLAMMDQDGTVALSSIGNVASRARVTEQEAADAIRVLESPDERNPGQELDGRRIERIPGIGWMVLNSAKYRDIIRADEMRAKTRERVRRHRCNAHVTQRIENVTPSEAEAGAKSDSKASEKSTHDKQRVWSPPVEAPTSEHQWNYEKSSPYVSQLRTIGTKIGPKNWQVWKSLVGEFTAERVVSAVKALPADARWPDKAEIALRGQGLQKPIGEVVKSKIIRITQ